MINRILNKIVLPIINSVLFVKKGSYREHKIKILILRAIPSANP